MPATYPPAVLTQVSHGIVPTSDEFAFMTDIAKLFDISDTVGLG